MSAHVVIIGAGAMGSVLGGFVAEGPDKKKVIYWDAAPDKVRNQPPLRECVPGAQAIFLCVPSGAVRVASVAIKPFLSKKTAVVTIAKGLEKGSGKTMDKVMKEALPKGQACGLLSGPMLAAELKSGQGGVAVVAVTKPAAFKTIQHIFTGSTLSLVYSKNTTAVAWAGVLKNVYAVALGVADGLGWGHNRKGWLVAQALHEMAVIAGALKISVDEVLGVAGLGDLVATGFSDTSRNHEAGKKLVNNEQLGSEGVRALPVLLKRISVKHKKDLPVALGIAAIIAGKKSAHQTFDALL